MLPGRGGTKHCCWGLCKSDSRYPERLPEGTFFISFPKPGKIRTNMTELEKMRAMEKCAKAKRWMYLCGRLDFQRMEKISINTYICSLHFVGGKGPKSEDDEPILCTPVVERRKRGISDTTENDETRRSLKRKRNKETQDRQKLQNMIAGRNFDIRDLQVQHVQLLKAFAEMQTEADQLRTENDKLKDALQSDFSKLSYRFLKCDNKQLQFLTGLNVVTFDWLVPKIARAIFRVHPEVNPQDHLLIVLMKLKLGLCDNDLGYRFQISGGIITAICQTWIPVLAGVLSPLIVWPSQDAIFKTRPSIFTQKTRRCRCIVDTFQIAIATPLASTKVVSYLISASPSGAISFVSPGFICKKKTDRQLMKESGFMEALQPMDLVLSNKIFPVQKELDAIGATLLTPDMPVGKKCAFVKGMKLPFSVWRHVEKVMNWWKDFGVFQTPIPADYEEMLDDVVVICAALTNVKMSLDPKVKNSEN